MDIFTMIFIAIGLSMDSFAVSIANGFIIKNLNIKKIFIIAFVLSIFQALMPLFGWFAGKGFEKYITKADHWTAFGLLSFLGLKMIYQGLKKKTGNNKKIKIKITTLTAQSFATSIDALAVGISFAFLNISILKPVLIIGITTFCFSLTGLYIGKFSGNKFGKTAEITGGLILIGIGTKILIEHICF